MPSSVAICFGGMPANKRLRIPTCRLVRWIEGSAVEWTLPEVVIALPESGIYQLRGVPAASKLEEIIDLAEPSDHQVRGIRWLERDHGGGVAFHVHARSGACPTNRSWANVKRLSMPASRTSSIHWRA